MKSSFTLIAAVATLSLCPGAQAAAASDNTAQNLCNYVIDGSGRVVKSSDGSPVRHAGSSQGDCEKVASAAPAPKPAPPPAPPPAPSVAPALAAAFDPPAGEYAAPQSVTLTSATPGSVIRYTTDGSIPTADSPAYADPIPVGKTTTLQALVVAPGAPNSAVSTSTYTIAPPAPPAPALVAVTKTRLELKEVVLFNTGKATIDPRSHSLLDEVAAALKNHPEVKSVRVEGHTDNTGAAAANVKLSQARAEVVREYLVARGVATDRLTAKGYGDKQPVASNKTADGRAANRRTDFIVTQD